MRTERMSERKREVGSEREREKCKREMELVRERESQGVRERWGSERERNIVRERGRKRVAEIQKETSESSKNIPISKIQGATHYNMFCMEIPDYLST